MTVDIEVGANYPEIYFRYKDSNNWWLVRPSSNNYLYIVENDGGSQTNRYVQDIGISQGDNLQLEIILSGDSVVVNLSGDRSDTFEYSSSLHASETKIGLGGYGGTPNHKLDNLRVVTA